MKVKIKIKVKRSSKSKSVAEVKLKSKHCWVMSHSTLLFTSTFTFTFYYWPTRNGFLYSVVGCWDPKSNWFRSKKDQIFCQFYCCELKLPHAEQMLGEIFCAYFPWNSGWQAICMHVKTCAQIVSTWCCRVAVDHNCYI